MMNTLLVLLMLSGNVSVDKPVVDPVKAGALCESKVGVRHCYVVG